MIGAPELIVTVMFLVLAPVVVLYAVYWIVRLGVRHGLADVRNRVPGGGSSIMGMPAPVESREVHRSGPA